MKLYILQILLLTVFFIASIHGESHAATVSVVKDKKVKILWRENHYNTELQDTMSMIVMDTSYCKTISDPEKAAIAFEATFVRNDCW